jgi:anthranilate phosphoribosyltransferase
MFGLKCASRDELYAETPQESANCIRSVLSGQPGACRDIVVLNAAAALWLVSPDNSHQQCAARIQSAIDDGHAARVLASLSAVSNQVA